MDIILRSEAYMTFRTVLRAAALPLFILALFLAFSFIYQALGLPASNELVKISESYFRRYGYLVVFIGAFLEATPVINFYLPGSAVIILAVAFSRHGTLNVFAVVAVATLGFLTAYLLDYLAGIYGWYRILLRFGLSTSLEKTRQRVLEHGSDKWLWLSYVHPNFGAVTATAYGTLHIPFVRFFFNSVGALLCWNTL